MLASRSYTVIYNPFTHSGLLATLKLSDAWNVQNGAGANGFVNSWGVEQYLTYQFTEKLSGTTRLEFFGDSQGWKTGFQGLYTAVTAGVTYKPRPCIWLRPELRYDNNSESRPFEGKPSLFTAALDVIIRW